VFVKEQTAETQFLTRTVVTAITMTTTKIPRFICSCGICGYVHLVYSYYDGNSFAALRRRHSRYPRRRRPYECVFGTVQYSIFILMRNPHYTNTEVRKYRLRNATKGKVCFDLPSFLPFIANKNISWHVMLKRVAAIF
jgi:hypothetical protein